MGNGRFNVAVSFDERRGYVGTHPGLRSPVTALSLGGLRRRIEIALLPEVDVNIRLELDRGARLERDRRRLQGRPRPQAFAAAKQLNRCPAAARSPACRSGPCNCLSAARPSILQHGCDNRVPEQWMEKSLNHRLDQVEARGVNLEPDLAGRNRAVRPGLLE